MYVMALQTADIILYDDATVIIAVQCSAVRSRMEDVKYVSVVELYSA